MMTCKMGIYWGEVRRHLVNCSEESTYEAKLQELGGALRRRGYPEALLQPAPYDAQLRENILENLHNRNLRLDVPSEIVAKKSVMAFKVPFSRALRRLGLNSELQGIVKKLRDEYGEAFMDGTRIVGPRIPSKRTTF